MEEIILVGYGGHAKSVADSIIRQGEYHIFGYTDSEKRDSSFPYLGTDDMLEKYYLEGIKYAFVCVGYLGNDDLREKLYYRLKKIGYMIPFIIDPSSVLASSVSVGEGTFVGKGAVVNAGSTIGRMAIINTRAVIEHDCIVGDFSHIAVGAVLCGAVYVSESCMIGAGSTIIHTIHIGANTIIGAGSIVINNIPNRCVAVGTPAKPIKYI